MSPAPIVQKLKNFTIMTPARSSLKKMYLERVPHTVVPHKFPSLSSISAKDLPSRKAYGTHNYYIEKSNFGHWPVYSKVQNTKISTEIKKVRGSVFALKRDLLEALPTLKESDITTNTTTGALKIKGNYSSTIKDLLSSKIN